MQKTTTAESRTAVPPASGTGRPLSMRFSRLWRILRTGLGFAIFGVISIAAAVIVMPLLRLLPGTNAAREMRSQRVVHLCSRIFLGILPFLRISDVVTSGAERLREPGQLIVANHPTLIDALLLISLMPQADCVIKGSHFHNPFLGWAASSAGYIANWEGPSIVDDCAERLMQGRSVIIFPEGTRSPVGSLGRFARGAAHIALRSGRDPIPVTIRCDPATLYHGIAWWDVPDRMFTLSASVGDPLLVKDYADPSMNPALAARAVTRGLRAHYVRTLGLAAHGVLEPDASEASNLEVC